MSWLPSGIQSPASGLASRLREALRRNPPPSHLPVSVALRGKAQLSVQVHLDIRTLRFRRERDRNASELMFVTVLFDRDKKYAAGMPRRLYDTPLF